MLIILYLKKYIIILIAAEFIIIDISKNNHQLDNFVIIVDGSYITD
jgi:hypothetical protein